MKTSMNHFGSIFSFPWNSQTNKLKMRKSEKSSDPLQFSPTTNFKIKIATEVILSSEL